MIHALIFFWLVLTAPKITNAEAAVLRAVAREQAVPLPCREFLYLVSLLDARGLIQHRGCLLLMTREGEAALMRWELTS